MQGVENLFDRQDRMAALSPTFCDITWGAGGSTADLTMKIATKMQNTVSLPAEKYRLSQSTFTMIFSLNDLACADLRGDNDAPHLYQHAKGVPGEGFG